MYILRTRDEEGTKTFEFNTIQAAEKAMEYIKRTTADAFLAEVKAPDDKHGKVLQRKVGDGYKKLTYSKTKKYETIEYEFGTEEECSKKCRETNREITCRFSVRAHMEHFVGPLWATVYTEPME